MNQPSSPQRPDFGEYCRLEPPSFDKDKIQAELDAHDNFRFLEQADDFDLLLMLNGPVLPHLHACAHFWVVLNIAAWRELNDQIIDPVVREAVDTLTQAWVEGALNHVLEHMKTWTPTQEPTS